MIRRILCPICFSTRLQPMLGTAIRVARVARAELVIVDAWYMPPFAHSDDVGWWPPEAVDAMIDKKEVELGLIVRQCKQAGVERVTSEMLSGIPSVQVLTLAELGSFDLIIIGTDHQTRHGEYRLAPGAKRLFRRSPCSVLVACHHDSRFTNVLCPVDLSEQNSRFAIELAHDLIAPDGTLTLLQIEELRDPLLDMVSTPTYDLVVIGAELRAGLRGKLFGTPAAKLLGRATCPVVYAHPRADLEPMLRAIR